MPNDLHNDIAPKFIQQFKKRLEQENSPYSISREETFDELNNLLSKVLSLLDTTISDESIKSSIQTYQSNPLYEPLRLKDDPWILELVISQLSEPKTIETLLDFSPKIDLSKQEKLILDKKLQMLTILATLKEDLEEIAEFVKEEEGEKDAFDSYFEELDQLETILSAQVTHLSDIKWFLYTDTLDLMLCDPKSFSITPSHIYQYLLDKARLHSKSDLDQQHQILLDKKTDAGENFTFDPFYSVFSYVKKARIIDIKKQAGPLSEPLSHPSSKFFNKKSIPGLALKNNLNNYLKRNQGEINLKERRQLTKTRIA